MRFSLMTVALCAAILSPASTFGHEGHDEDVTDSTILDPNAPAFVVSLDGHLVTYLVKETPEAPKTPETALPLGSITMIGSDYPFPTTSAHVHNQSSIDVSAIEVTSMGWVDRHNSSMDGFTTYTANPSTKANRTENSIKPTATEGSMLPADVPGIAIRTAPAAAALVAFIAAGVAVLA